MPKFPNRAKSSGLALALIPLLAIGQLALAAPTAPPQSVGGAWDFLHLDPKVKVKLSFRNANIDNIIELFENASQITILKDPTLKGPMTLTTAKSVRLPEAFHVLNAMLKLQGYEITRDAEILVIQKVKPPTPPQPREQAAQPPAPPVPTETVVVWYPLAFANASQVARAINDIFQPFPPNPEPRGRDRQQVQPRERYPSPQMPPVRATYEEFSNSVIINAPQAQQNEMSDLIKEIDEPQSAGQVTKAYPLQFATATDILPSVITMLAGNVVKGRGWKGNNSLAQQFFGYPYSQDQNLAVADARTNSILVSGPPDLIKVADKVIEALDQKREYIGTSYVFKLKYARADAIANLLTSAFGQRQGVNNNFRPSNTTLTPSNNVFNNTATNARPNLKVRGGSKLTPPTSTTGQTGQTAQPGAVDQGATGNSLAVPLQDPNSTSGDLLTSVGVTQTLAKPVVGHDSEGKVVTVHDLAGQVSVVADTNTNSIICVTAPDNLEIIKNIIDQLDVRPDQVMIQTIIVEATLDKAKQFGLEWNYAQGKSGTLGQNFGLQSPPTTTGTTSPTPPLQGFSYTLTSGNLSAFFNMLQTDTKFQVLATPRIFTSNNMESQINISQSIPYVTNTIENLNGTFSFNYNFEDVGIVLTVTPHITNDGYVTMDVLQTANDLQGYTTFNAPIVNQRQAETTISAKDNETIVLGGMIRNQVTSTVNKVPILGDIPLLGNLFKSTNMDHNKTELLVFLTPRIIRDPAEAEKLKNDTSKELVPETQKALKAQAKGAGK